VQGLDGGPKSLASAAFAVRGRDAADAILFGSIGVSHASDFLLI
jgi:hypothetical protein